MISLYVFHKRILKAGCVFLGAVLLLFAFIPAVNAADDIESCITAAFDGRRLHSTKEARLLSDPAFLEKNAGTGLGDWTAFAMARYGNTDSGTNTYFYDEDYGAYLTAVDAALRSFYEENGVTSGTKLTEYFRMGIAVTALGGDCGDIILAATLNNPVKLARLSIITLVYSLIAVEMTDLAVPEDPAHTPQDYVDRILALQTEDGGWALNSMLGGGADVDVTAMALTALGPFYRAGDETVTAAAERALDLLASRQSNKGDFYSYGIFNCESTAQVLTALTSLGIDPLQDTRFIKEGATVLDGLLRYRLADGSFTHSFTEDPDNDAAETGKYNYLATDQASYALVALWRQQNGLNALYDLRPEAESHNAQVIQKLFARIRDLLARLTAMIQSIRI